MLPSCSTHPEALALLGAALASPVDPTPRLVLADWLDEHDHGAIAAAIRESVAANDWVYLDHPTQMAWTHHAPWDGVCDGWLGLHSGVPVPGRPAGDFETDDTPENLAALSPSPWFTSLRVLLTRR